MKLQSECMDTYQLSSKTPNVEGPHKMFDFPILYFHCAAGSQLNDVKWSVQTEQLKPFSASRFLFFFNLIFFIFALCPKHGDSQSTWMKSPGPMIVGQHRHNASQTYCERWVIYLMNKLS